MSALIAKPPWTSLGKKLESTLRKALYDFHMLDGVSKLAVALSGGKDSLAMLFLLHAIIGKGFPHFNLCAIHVSGEFSCGASVQEQFLQDICEELNIEFLSRTSTQKLETLECYSCSRERRRLLFDAALSIGATTIAFGHHQDDQAQTVLMNLLHKGEFAGNLPKIHMQEYGITIIRPLIYISEKDIRSFAQQQGFARITCRCPVGQTSLRRKTDEMIANLEAIFPNARKNIAQAGLIYGSQKAAKP